MPKEIKESIRNDIDWVNYAVVVRCTLDQVQQLKSFLVTNKIPVHYQRFSSGYLKILDDDWEESHD